MSANCLTPFRPQTTLGDFHLVDPVGLWVILPPPRPNETSWRRHWHCTNTHSITKHTISICISHFVVSCSSAWVDNWFGAIDFLIMWPWPWPRDLDIRTWPIYSEDEPAHQNWSFYVKAFKSCNAIGTDRQTDVAFANNEVVCRAIRLNSTQFDVELSWVESCCYVQEVNTTQQSISHWINTVIDRMMWTITTDRLCAALACCHCYYYYY